MLLLMLVFFTSSTGILLAQYCAPAYVNGCFVPMTTDDNIDDFWTTGAVGNITNMNTGCTGTLPTNYTYYSNLTLTVMRGTTFTVNMQCNQGQIPGFQFAQGFKIWVDWDQNGTFDNGGTSCELAYNSNTSGFQVFTGTVTVPSTATLGTTRMRVRCSFAGVPVGPCTSENYGETEDYNVLVIDNPTNPGLTAQDVTICAGQTATLTASGGGIIRWYATQTSASFIAIGPNYTTPVLNTTTTYWVQTTINGCPSPRIPVTVNVIPPFTITPTASAATVCAGNPVTLNGPAGYATYSWTPAIGITNPAVNPATANPTAATTYTLTVTDANGCSGSGTVSVGVDAAPTLNIAASTTAICPGTNVTLTASGSPNAYNWLATAGFTATTGTTVTVSPAATTTYTVTSTSGTGGCPATATQTITVHPVPVADAGPDVAHCIGASTTLQGSGGTSYSWSPAVGLSSSTAASPTVSAPLTGSYVLTVTNAQGCSDTDDVLVTVNPLPVANPGLGAANCSGTGAQLNGSGGNTYQWAPATGLNNAAIANPVATPNTSTNYTLTVTDANGCVSPPSAPITVTVFNQPNPPAITASGPLTFCQGGSVTLSVTGGVSYQWSNGQTGSSITVSQSGNYSVTLTDGNGCTSPSSAPVTVTVTPGPPAPVINAAGPLTFCQGGSVQLNSSAATSYTWSNGASTASITVNTSGNYSVTIADANGCQSTSNPIAVTVNPNPTTPVITNTGAAAFCPGGSTQLQAPSANSYAWSNGATTQSITVNQTGIFTVTITDANGCVSLPSAPFSTTLHPQPPVPIINAGGPLSFCQGSAVTLSTTGAQSYQWSNGATTSTISPAASGTFTVSIIDFNGCPSAPSAPVNVIVWPLPPAPVISASGALAFCEGGSVTLQSTGTGLISWNNGQTGTPLEVLTSGQYTATQTDANGCTSLNSNPLQVNVLPLSSQPVITAMGPLDICQGDSVTLSSSLALSYLWNTGATTREIKVGASGNYTVTTTSPCPGPNMTASISVQVRPFPVPQISASTTTACIPDRINFSASSSGIGPFIYNWNFGNGATSNSAAPTYQYTQPGSYTVSLTLTDVIGCTGSSTLPEPINMLPRANLSYNISPKSTTLSASQVTFTGLTDNAVSHSWTIESAGSFDTSVVVHQFDLPGNYLVMYEVLTEEGCEAKRFDTVYVYEDFMLYIPSAFSPNGDGLNDEFIPICAGFDDEEFSFQVFNRWGELLFSTKYQEKGWDGSNAYPGVYTWLLTGRSKKDLEQKVYKGSVKLME
jgi:large repetitive protein